MAKLVTEAATNLPASSDLSAKERWTLVQLCKEVAANAEHLDVIGVWATIEAFCRWSFRAFERALLRDDLKTALGPSVAGGAIASASVFTDAVSKWRKLLKDWEFKPNDLRDETNQRHSASVQFSILTKRGVGFALVARVTVDGQLQGLRFDWQSLTQILDLGIPARLAPDLVRDREAMPARTSDATYEIAIATKLAETERALREEYGQSQVTELQSTVVRRGTLSGKKFLMVTAATLLIAGTLVAAVPAARNWALELLRSFMRRAAATFSGQRFEPQATPSDVTSSQPQSVGATPAAFARAIYEVTSLSSPEFKGELTLDPEYELQFLGDASLRIHVRDAGDQSIADMEAIVDPSVLGDSPRAGWVTPLRFAWGVYRVLGNGDLQPVYTRLGSATLTTHLSKPTSYLVVMSYARIRRLDEKSARVVGHELVNVRKTSAKYIGFAGPVTTGHHVVRFGAFHRPDAAPGGFRASPSDRGVYTFEGSEEDARQIADSFMLSPVLAHMSDHAAALSPCAAQLVVRGRDDASFARPASRIGPIDVQKVVCFNGVGDLEAWDHATAGPVRIVFSRSGTFQCVNMLLGPRRRSKDGTLRMAIQSCGQTVRVSP